MKYLLAIACFCFETIFLDQPLMAQIPKDYKGKPFKDKYYKLGAQSIPGRVELAYYDLGGEGIAYHDNTPENEGSKLNHEVHDYGSHHRLGISTYTAFFREKEGVDISYTKDWADFNHPIRLILLLTNSILVGNQTMNGPITP